METSINQQLVTAGPKVRYIAHVNARLYRPFSRRHGLQGQWLIRSAVQAILTSAWITRSMVDTLGRTGHSHVGMDYKVNG